MDIILKDTLTARNNHYVHALEVECLESLKSTIEQLVLDFEDKYSHSDIIDFISTLEIYHLSSGELSDEENETQESEIYSFCVQSYVGQLLGY